MHLLDKTAWEILNATADDCENLEQIYLQICFEVSANAENTPRESGDYRPLKGAPLLSEIADGIQKLVGMGLLAVEMDENGVSVQNLDNLSYIWRAWFRMTPQGRGVWASSEYTNLVEQE